MQIRRIVLCLLIGINAAVLFPTPPNVWNDKDLSVFGLGGLAYPKGAGVCAYRYSAKTNSLTAAFSPVESKEYAAFVRKAFSKMTASDQPVKDRSGKVIQSVSESLKENGTICQFLYESGGKMFFATITYYQDGDTIYNYEKKTVVLNIIDGDYF